MIAASIWREHRVFLLLVAVYIVAGFSIGLHNLLPASTNDLAGSLILQLATLLSGLVLLAELLLTRLRLRDAEGRRVNGWRGWREAWLQARAGSLSGERLGRGLVALAGVVLLGRAFIAWKAAIPSIHPFAWDARLHRLDALMHGGQAPWRLLQPLLGHPGMTRLLDGAYLVWHPVLIAVVVWFAWRREAGPRTRFFITFALCWIVIGTGLALMFSSAGPCFYALVTGEADPYGPLLTYLAAVDRQAPLSTVRAQAWLWDQYRTGGTIVSISAMPSMHVAMPVLYSLATWRDDRRLRWVLAGYAVSVLLASVHLGWHYALDGYVAALVTAGLWALSGRLTGEAGARTRSHSRSDARPQDPASEWHTA